MQVALDCLVVHAADGQVTGRGAWQFAHLYLVAPKSGDERTAEAYWRSFTKFKGLQFRRCNYLIGLSQRNRVRLKELEELARRFKECNQTGQDRLFHLLGREATQC